MKQLALSLAFGVLGVWLSHGIAYYLLTKLPDAALIAAGLLGAALEQQRLSEPSAQFGSYWQVLSALVSGNLGLTLDGIPVSREIMQGLAGSTPQLVAASLLVLCTVLVVAYASARSHTQGQEVLESLAFLPVYVPICMIWLAVSSTVLYASSGALAVASAVALAVPSLALIGAQSAAITRENLQSNFTRTYRGCGLSERRIRTLLLRNLVNQLLPSLEKVWVSMFTTLIFVESIFGIAGIGSVAARAIRRSDIGLTLAVVLTVATGAALARIATACLTIQQPQH